MPVGKKAWNLGYASPGSRRNLTAMGGSTLGKIRDNRDAAFAHDIDVWNSYPICWEIFFRILPIGGYVSIRIVTLTTDKVFSSLHILKFNDLYKYAACKFMYQHLHGKTPTCFRNFATHLSNENRTNSFFLPQVKYAIFKHFPNYSLPKFWNDLGLGLKLCDSFKTFKMLLKKEIFQQYGSV